jgi:hypothetical protein
MLAVSPLNRVVHTLPTESDVVSQKLATLLKTPNEI